MMMATTSSMSCVPLLTCDKALEVARLDAEKVYRDLDRYRIQITLEPDGWHVEYWLKNPRVQGGGPHYVIDVVTGAILWKTYYQ
jgi:hypothetical protein